MNLNCQLVHKMLMLYMNSISFRESKFLQFLFYPDPLHPPTIFSVNEKSHQSIFRSSKQAQGWFKTHLFLGYQFV